MKRKFYEILNLDERLLPYFLDDIQGNENGYYTTIDKKLSYEEQENLTAVMIWRKIEERRKNKDKKRRGEDR